MIASKSQSQATLSKRSGVLASRAKLAISVLYHTLPEQATRL
jgi:hypothetical protein